MIIVFVYLLPMLALGQSQGGLDVLHGMPSCGVRGLILPSMNL